MRRLLGITLAVLSLLPAAAKAQEGITQEPVVLSLQGAMDYAVKHNDSAKNARLSILVQKAKNAEITGIALPNITSNAQYQDYMNPMKSFIPGEFFGAPGTFIPVQFTPKYNVSASGTASQILFDGSVLVALQAKKAILELSKNAAKLSEEELRYNVQKAYFGLIIANKQFGILTSSLAAARQSAYELQVTYNTGLAEKIEVDRSQVQVNNLATDSIRIKSMLAVSEYYLKFQLGMDMDQPIILTDTVFEQSIADAEGLLNETEDYNNRTDYNLLQGQLKLNEYDLKRHRLSGLPSLSVFASAGYNYSNNSFSEVTKPDNYLFNSYYGFRINWPIFDGGQRYNRVRQAKLNVQKNRNSIEYLKLGIDLQTSQSKTMYKNSLLTLESQRRNVALATSVFDLSQRKYKEGVGSNLEVTTAQSQLLLAQSNYFTSMQDAINAKSDLQKALGQFK